MASRAAPCNMLMRTTLPCSANAVGYHGLGWHFQSAAARQPNVKGSATIRPEDIPRARRPGLAALSCSASVGCTPRRCAKPYMLQVRAAAAKA